MRAVSHRGEPQFDRQFDRQATLAQPGDRSKPQAAAAQRLLACQSSRQAASARSADLYLADLDLADLGSRAALAALHRDLPQRSGRRAAFVPVGDRFAAHALVNPRPEDWLIDHSRDRAAALSHLAAAVALPEARPWREGRREFRSRAIGRQAGLVEEAVVAGVTLDVGRCDDLQTVAGHCHRHLCCLYSRLRCRRRRHRRGSGERAAALRFWLGRALDRADAQAGSAWVAQPA